MIQGLMSLLKKNLVKIKINKVFYNKKKKLIINFLL